MANKEELVSISQNEDGSLTIHEFKKVDGTSLGEEVRNALGAEGLEIKEEKNGTKRQD